MSTGEPGLDTFDMALFVSTDGGETWQRRPLPYVSQAQSRPAEVGYKGDPTLAWTGEETLHVAGYVNNDLTLGDLEIFAARSPDAGESWKATTVLSAPGSSDRPWISRSPNGTVFGTWTRSFDDQAPLAVRHPGSSWERRPGASTVDPCQGASPVAFADRTPVVACAENDSVSVHAHDPGDGVEERGRVALDGARYPLLTDTPNGSLVLAGSTDAATGSVPLWLSHDGGRTWTEAVDAAGLAGLDGEDVEATWVATDPWGSVHVLLRAFPPGASVPFQGDRVGRPTVVHAAFSPDLSEVLASQRLDPPGQVQDGRPESVETDTGDHYFGIAFGPDRGYLAWTEDRSLRLTAVEPVFEANETG